MDINLINQLSNLKLTEQAREDAKVHDIVIVKKYVKDILTPRLQNAFYKVKVYVEADSPKKVYIGMQIGKHRAYLSIVNLQMSFCALEYTREGKRDKNTRVITQHLMLYKLDQAGTDEFILDLVDMFKQADDKDAYSNRGVSTLGGVIKGLSTLGRGY